MRNYYPGRKITDDDVREALDARYPRSTATGLGGEGARWDTPYGLSFAEPKYQYSRTLLAQDWYFIYDKVGQAYMTYGMPIGEDKGGWLERQEILHLIEIFDKQGKEPGFSIYKKPQVVQRLECLLGVKARLHYMHCLQWNVSVEKKVSCHNNPFGTAHAYASGDSFEVSFLNTEEDALEYIGIDTLERLIGEKNLIAPSMRCRCCGKVAPGLKPLPNCLRCKEAHYCNKSCQTNDWNLHNHRAKCRQKKGV